jgi:outer membrane protein TolC
MMAIGAFADGQNPVREVEARDTAAAQDSSQSGNSPGYSIESSAPESFIIDLEKIKLDKFYEVLQETGGPEELPLSLMDCVQRALESNQDIEVAEFTPLKSDGSIMSAEGEFDPVLSGNIQYSESSSQASSQTVAFGGISSIESYSTAMDVSLSGRMRWGTQYTVGMNLNDQEDTFNDFIEEWSGNVNVSITQPLLRGRGRAFNMARIRQAKNSRVASESQLHLTVMNTISSVTKAYWDLVGAVENVRVRFKSLDNAERLLDITQKRLEIGTASPLEVVQAQAGLAARQSDLITAQSQVKDGSDRLRRLLNMQDEGVVAHQSISPTDTPGLLTHIVDPVKSVENAIRFRPEVRNAQLSVESADIDRARARSDMLPQIDLTGTATRGGRDHKISGVVDGTRDGSDTSFSIGLRGSLPLRNRAARGAFHTADVSAREAAVMLDRTIEDVKLSVLLAARAVDTSRILVESNRQTRILQEINLAAEERRLRLGLTTNYRVLQVEEDLTTAEVGELQATVNLEKAIVDLNLAEGTILQDFGIEFETPEHTPNTTYWRSINPWKHSRQ